MLKKFLLVFLVLFALFSCSAAMAEPRLVTIHESVVNYVYSEDSEVHNSRDWTGVISYDNARFFCLTLEVDDDENELPEVDYKNPPKFALSGGNYSFWNSKNVQAVNNTSMSFDIARNDSLFWVSNDLRQWGGDKPGYVPTNSEGDWIHFLNAADGGMSGVTVSWTFPEMYGLTGSSDTVPTMKTTNEQLADFVPYIEYVGTGVINQETGINKGIDGLNITGIKWRLVKSSDVDSPITLSDDIHIEIRNAFGENQESPSYENQKGYTLVSSGNVISGEISLGDDYGFFPYCTIVRYYIGDNKDEIYQWRFVSQNGAFLDNFGAVLGGGKGGTVSWVAGLKDGKADYTYVTYGGTDVSSVATWPVICEGKHLTDKGKLTIKGGGTFSIVDAEFGNVIQEFDTSEDIVLPLSTRSPLGGSMAEYSYSIEGYRKADWNYLSDAYSTRGVAFMDPTGSLSNKTVKWEFPEEVDAKGRLNGEGKIRNVKTLEQQFNTATGFFPYVELISDDEGNLKEVNYRIVRSPDISQAYNPGVVCYLDIFINCDGNQVTGPNVEQLTNADTSEFNSDNFESKFHIEGKWTPTNPVKFGTYHNVSVNLQVYEKLTKEEFEALGLDYGQFIGNANLFTPYTWIFTDYPPVAEIHFMNNSEFENVSTDSVAAAIDGFNATDNIQAVQREEVYEESGVDENVISYFENEDSELVGRFKQLYSESEGWVVTKVTLPDELYDNLQDVSADNLAVYSITDAELQEQAAISKHNNNFLNWFITPAFADSTTSKTGKLVNLDGSKLDKINSKELLMVSYLKAGQKSNMYLGFNASATPAPTPTPTPTPTPEPENENPESDPANESESGKNQTSTIETASGTISNGVFVTKAGNNKSIAEIIAELGANAASITGFVINNTAITKLTSADLKALSSLVSLDLSGASALTEIDFSGASIKVLKISSNTAIQTMNFSGSSIEDLDTNACTNLTSLNLGNCKNLKTLNTKGCKNLKVLILSGCEKTLTTLNIKGNSLLLIDLSNFGSQLTSLDVSGQVRDNLKVGKKINLKEFFDTSNDYSDNVTISEATNTSGDVLEWKITSGEIEFNGVPDKFKYYFNTGFTKITADFFASASSNDVSMDVSITSDGTTVDDDGVLGSSGGGCNLGIGIFVLSILGVLINLSVKH